MLKKFSWYVDLIYKKNGGIEGSINIDKMNYELRKLINIKGICMMVNIYMLIKFNLIKNY